MTASGTRRKLAVSRHEARAVPIGSVKPFKRNPRRGDIDAIRQSLRVNGQYRPIVVRLKTSEVLAGNHTLAAAKAEGWDQIWATFVDVDAQTAKRIVLADNRIPELGGYDDGVLADLLGELPTLEGTGFTDDALRRLLADTLPERPAPPDEAPAKPKTPKTKSGDLYVLGDHRLLCGDSTDPETVALLMDGDLADVVWTDPPYGVEYVGKTARALTIANDSADGLREFLSAAFAATAVALRPGAAIYMATPFGPQLIDFLVAFGEQWRHRQTLVWVKDAMVLGHSDYHYKHEALLLGESEDTPPRGEEHVSIATAYSPGEGRRGRGGEGWYGDNKQVSVLTVPRPKASREHPTMKPVELIEIALRNSSAPGHVVLDPFGGSGSTLMACEHLQRKARLVELEPAYCDVIVSRWESYTGEKAERIRGR